MSLPAAFYLPSDTRRTSVSASCTRQSVWLCVVYPVDDQSSAHMRQRTSPRTQSFLCGALAMFGRSGYPTDAARLTAKLSVTTSKTVPPVILELHIDDAPSKTVLQVPAVLPAQLQRCGTPGRSSRACIIIRRGPRCSTFTRMGRDIGVKPQSVESLFVDPLHRMGQVCRGAHSVESLNSSKASTACARRSGLERSPSNRKLCLRSSAGHLGETTVSQPLEKVELHGC